MRRRAQIHCDGRARRGTAHGTGWDGRAMQWVGGRLRGWGSGRLRAARQARPACKVMYWSLSHEEWRMCAPRGGTAGKSSRAVEEVLWGGGGAE